MAIDGHLEDHFTFNKEDFYGMGSACHCPYIHDLSAWMEISSPFWSCFRYYG